MQIPLYHQAPDPPGDPKQVVEPPEKAADGLYPIGLGGPLQDLTEPLIGCQLGLWKRHQRRREDDSSILRWAVYREWMWLLDIVCHAQIAKAGTSSFVCSDLLNGLMKRCRAPLFVGLYFLKLEVNVINGSFAATREWGIILCQLGTGQR